MSQEENDVSIKVSGASLRGALWIPQSARALVIFAHGSGSSRHSPRNQFVAGILQKAGLATLLFDLMTADEERADSSNAKLRFDIAFLAKRLVGAMDWAAGQAAVKGMRFGLFGSSTGAAAALVAAVERPALAGAVVSRGGRPDLAGPALARVKAATLLIVGGNDAPVLELNLQAMNELQCSKKLQIVPRATHLFEEPGTLERAAGLARDWFVENLTENHEASGNGTLPGA